MHEHALPNYDRKFRALITSVSGLDEWDPEDENCNNSRNYQRWNLAVDHDLEYKERSTRLGEDVHMSIKSIHCVNTMMQQWFVTFGLVDRFMYLLEERFTTKKRALRMTGIFEPSGVINNRDSEYFYNQCLESKGEKNNIPTLKQYITLGLQRPKSQNSGNECEIFRNEVKPS